MKKLSENNNWDVLRQKVIGLGETSLRKNYYAELQNRLDELERFRFLLDCTLDSILVAEIPSGNFIDFNKSASDLLGYNKEDLLSKSINDILEPHFAHEIIDFSAGTNPQKKYQKVFSTSVKTVNGNLIPVEISINSGNFFSKVYAVILIRDIAERKKNEDELKQYKFILDNAGEEIFLLHPDGRFAYLNEAASSSLKYPIEELIGKNISLVDFTWSEDKFYNHFLSLKEKDMPLFETSHISKDGQIIPKEIKSVYLKIGDNEYACSFARNISERKKHEAELRKLSRAVHQSSSLIIITDLLGKIEYVNPKFTEVAGFSLEDIFGEIPQFLSYETKNPDRFRKVWSTILSGNEWKEELEFKRKNGQIFWTYSSISPVLSDEGKVTHILCIAEDITEIKNAEKELIVAKEKAEKSDRLKSEFLAQVSHEIRTPVNTILNYISLVREELQSNITDELQFSFKAIDNGSRRLIKTVDSLINMSQVQTGNYDFKPSRIDLEKDVLDGIILDYHFQVKAKGIGLNFCNKSDNQIITGDLYSVTQILSNLIDNAVKYTSQGQINITLFNNDNTVSVEIADTGIGISEDYMPFLFEPFSQEDTGYRRRFDGNGLGLALVIKYAELNGAEINVNSQKGVGTKFTVSFRSK